MIFDILLLVALFVSIGLDVQNYLARRQSKNPALRVFGGTLAIDPAKVLSVSIIDDPTESSSFDGREPCQIAAILTNAGCIHASEKAGEELIHSFKSNSPLTPSATTPAIASEGNAAT